MKHIERIIECYNEIKSANNDIKNIHDTLFKRNNSYLYFVDGMTQNILDELEIHKRDMVKEIRLSAIKFLLRIK